MADMDRITHYTGRDLKAERVRAGLTQDELAARLGVSRSRISALEAAYRPASTATDRILTALGLTDRPAGGEADR